MNYVQSIVLVIALPLINICVLMPAFFLILASFRFHENSIYFFSLVMIWMVKLSGMFLVIGLIKPQWVLWKNPTRNTREKVALIYGSIFYWSFLNIGAVYNYIRGASFLSNHIFNEIFIVLVFMYLLMLLSTCLFFFLLILGLVSPQNFFWGDLGKKTRKKAFVVYGSLFYLSLFGMFLASIPIADA